MTNYHNDYHVIKDYHGLLSGSSIILLGQSSIDVNLFCLPTSWAEGRGKIRTPSGGEKKTPRPEGREAEAGRRDPKAAPV